MADVTTEALMSVTDSDGPSRSIARTRQAIAARTTPSRAGRPRAIGARRSSVWSRNQRKEKAGACSASPGELEVNEAAARVRGRRVPGWSRVRRVATNKEAG